VDRTSARLRLRVTPGARRPRIAGRHGNAWKVHVASPPERGRGNAAVLDVLAATLGVPRRQLEIVSGSSARDKLVAVDGLSDADVEAKLTAAAGDVR
jgi:uncharacterized protein (TIGR00251 family)